MSVYDELLKKAMANAKARKVEATDEKTKLAQTVGFELPEPEPQPEPDHISEDEHLRQLSRILIPGE